MATAVTVKYIVSNSLSSKLSKNKPIMLITSNESMQYSPRYPMFIIAHLTKQCTATAANLSLNLNRQNDKSQQLKSSRHQAQLNSLSHSTKLAVIHRIYASKQMTVYNQKALIEFEPTLYCCCLNPSPNL